MPTSNIHPSLGLGSSISWRPFPCPSCRGERTPGSYLRECLGASATSIVAQYDEQIEIESRFLVDWTKNCPHSQTQILEGPPVAEGSEHRVYLFSDSGIVRKITLPKVYGDWYYLKAEVIFQERATPLEYLTRLEIWDFMFGFQGAAQTPIGITSIGQIVTEQRFIKCNPPTQSQVDDFLEADGWMPLKKKCFLWQKKVSGDLEVRMGDARDENFALLDGTLIPIDIRLWFVKSND